MMKKNFMQLKKSTKNRLNKLILSKLQFIKRKLKLKICKIFLIHSSTHIFISLNRKEDIHKAQEQRENVSETEGMKLLNHQINELIN